MTPDLVFHVSHVRVEVICPHDQVLKGIRAIWGNAESPQLPVTRVARVSLSEPAPFTMMCDGEELAELDEARLLPQFERRLYQLIRGWHQEYTVLHGALLQRDDDLLMVTGSSDTGKSSLALHAVRQGWQYRTDEITVTDGVRLWGVSRAIQFNPTPVGSSLPDFLRDADTDSYQWLDHDGSELFQPVYSYRWQGSNCPLECQAASVVFLERSARFSCSKLPAVDALARLYAATFIGPHHDLGVLAANAWLLQYAELTDAFRVMEMPAIQELG